MAHAAHAALAARLLLALLLIVQGVATAVAGLHLASSRATGADATHAAASDARGSDTATPCHASTSTHEAPVDADAATPGDAGCCERGDCDFACATHVATAVAVEWRAMPRPATPPLASPPLARDAPAIATPIRPPIA